jgi:hypothetical protein
MWCAVNAAGIVGPIISESDKLHAFQPDVFNMYPITSEPVPFFQSVQEHTPHNNSLNCI